MVLWIILTIYVLGYILNWKYLAWAFRIEPLDGETVAIAMIMATIISLIWPGVVIFRIIRAKNPDGSWIMPRNVKKQKELEEREKEIKRMERELGIK